MTNNSSTPRQWTLWASIIALVFAVLSLCGGWFVPYASLLCPVVAIVLAALSLRSPRKTLPIIALVLSILSFCLLAGLGFFVWTSPESVKGSGDLGSALEALINSLGHLFQSLFTLIKTTLNIH
jgi:hypothetical protein